MIRNIGLCLVLLLLAGVSFSQEAVDREYSDQVKFLNDDGEVQTADEIKVTEATYRKVVYEHRGGRKTEKRGSRVLSVLYGDAPKVYTDGLQALSRGQFDKAVSDFEGAKNAVAAGRSRKWLLEYAAVKMAEALKRKGPDSSADGVTQYEKALEENPESLLYDVIQIGLAECYVMQEMWDEASAAAQKLVDAGSEIKHATWQARGRWVLAEGRLANKLYGEAINDFQDIVLFTKREIEFAKGEKRKKELRKLNTEAAVEQGWVRVARAEDSGQKSDWDNARRYFEGLPAQFPHDATHPENKWVAAAVLNGVGRCLLDSEPRAALFKFVEAEVTHFTSRREVARALYLKALALRKMKGARNLKMAEEALKELREFYPGSEWARR